MKLKLKKTIIMLLCIMLFTSLLCGCGKEKTNKEESNSTSENALDENKYNKEEYVERITAYKEYYEGIESDYKSVNGAILVNENGMPYMVLCYIQEEDFENYYKVQLIDYEKGKTTINGEKELFFEHQVEIQLAFIDNRCIFKAENSEASIEEYWEFEQGNLVAEKLDEKEAEEFEVEINGLGYVYDIAGEPCEYLYTIKKGDYGFVPGLDEYRYYEQEYFIYDEKSDKSSVNKVASKRLYDYMQLTDEQKEYFQYPKTNDEGEEILISDVINICYFRAKCDISSIFWINGVTFRQCLNELIEEPLYKIEDLLIKEISSSEDFIESKNSVENRKKEALNQIDSLMPKYNPYDTDEQLLREYYYGIREICVGKGVSINAGGYTIDANTLPYYPTDLATLMGMYNVTRALEVMFEESPLKYDYIFTSDEFKGATWKDITFNGSHEYPVLTLSKNGNVMSCSVFDSYTEFRENTELKRAIEAYAAFARDDYEYAFAYIDEDDIPEMIVSLYNYQHGALINEFYSYNDGELIRVGFNPDMRFDGYLPKQNSIAIFEEDYFYEEDGTSYRDGKYTQYSIVDDDIKYVKDIEWTEEYEPVTFEKDIISALGKIYSLTNGI